MDVRLERVMERGFDDVPGPLSRDRARDLIRHQDREAAGYMKYLFNIDWQEAQGERFVVRLALEGNDRRGLYADVAAAVSSTGTDIKSMDLRSTDGRTNGSMLVEVENLNHLEKIIRATRRVKGITDVARRERLVAE